MIPGSTIDARRLLAAACAILSLAACSSAKGTAPGPVPPDDGGGDPPPHTLAGDLQALSSRALYFGHQSVGGNVMTGVETLLAANTGAEPTVYYPATDPSLVSPGVWAHAYIGSNGDPVGKIAAFVTVMKGGMGAKVDVAFMKFCFADFWKNGTVPFFDGGGTVQQLFDQYKAAMGEIAAARPGLKLVHLTVPLWSDETVSNGRREAFSDLVRAEYGANVFDIADLEATDPTGAPVRDANGVRAMYAGYTSDGGHLNAAGQDVVARALVAFLAALP